MRFERHGQLHNNLKHCGYVCHFSSGSKVRARFICFSSVARFNLVAHVLPLDFFLCQKIDEISMVLVAYNSIDFVEASKYL